MAKQTFTSGQVLTAAQMTSLQANDYNQTVSAKTANYVLVAADAGTTITMNSATATTITVNTSLFTAGDTLRIQNIGAGSCVVTAGTATVTSAGSLTLPQWAGGTLYFTSAAASVFFPNSTTVGLKVLQVVSTNKTSVFTTTSSTFTDVTGLSVSITPTSATSTILVLSSFMVGCDPTLTSGFFRLMRGSTAIDVGDAAGLRIQATNDITAINGDKQAAGNIMFVDSPATTSATTYKIQVASPGASTVAIGASSTDTNSVGRSRTVSSITVLEIAA